MADDLTDTVGSGSPSFMSLLNKLPTKRIDAAITRAREADIPEQGEQTGGYTHAYVHLQHLPLFPLYSNKQLDIQAKAAERKERLVRDMDRSDPDKRLTGTQKLGLTVLGHIGGGGSMVSTKRWERRLIGANVASSQMIADQNKLMVLTRWTVPNASHQYWFIDVLEHRFLDPESKMAKFGRNMNSVTLKIGVPKDSKVTLKLLSTEAKGVKGQKVWNRGLNKEHCEAIAYVDGEGKEVPMEIVARVQRTSSSLEAAEMLKRFDKEWRVPEM